MQTVLVADAGRAAAGDLTTSLREIYYRTSTR